MVQKALESFELRIVTAQNILILLLCSVSRKDIKVAKSKWRDQIEVYCNNIGFWIYFKCKAIGFAVGLNGGRSRHRNIKDDPRFLGFITRNIMSLTDRQRLLSWEMLGLSCVLDI